MKWLVFGAHGLLGHELIPVLTLGNPSNEIYAPTRSEVDITYPPEVAQAVDSIQPDVVINLAAWTDVDGAESKPLECARINEFGARAIADAVYKTDAILIHLSTDYVFGAEASSKTPWPEDAPVSPRSVYGRTKAAGEKAMLTRLPEQAYIVRTGWLYGGGGKNFVTTMLERADHDQPVSVVDDQWGQPTWTQDLAHQLQRLALAAISQQAPAGVYHATAAGYTNWFELAQVIYHYRTGSPNLVFPITSRDLDRPAPRPRWSVLGHDRWSKAGLSPMRSWREALDEFLASTHIT